MAEHRLLIVDEKPYLPMVWFHLPLIQQVPYGVTVQVPAGYTDAATFIASCSSVPFGVIDEPNFTTIAIRPKWSALAMRAGRMMVHAACAVLLEHDLPSTEWIACAAPWVSELSSGERLYALNMIEGFFQPEVMERFTKFEVPGFETVVCRAVEDYPAFMHRVLAADYVVTVPCEISYARAMCGKLTYVVADISQQMQHYSTPLDRFIQIPMGDDSIMQTALNYISSWPELLQVK